MRYFGFIFLLTSFFLSSCNNCADVNCLNGGECNDGTCICPDGFTGEYCETTANACTDIDCGPNGTCVDGTCVCAEGWTGEFCDMEVTDPCVDVVCGANGTCVAGVCICDSGYEGDNCELLSRDKFLGSYNVAETCDSGTYTYAISIVASGVSVTQVDITNLYDAGQTTTASVDGNTLTIGSQTFGTGTIVGSGTTNGNTITITVTISVGGNSESCTLVTS